jgi:hypothetical protein
MKCSEYTGLRKKEKRKAVLQNTSLDVIWFVQYTQFEWACKEYGDCSNFVSSFGWRNLLLKKSQYVKLSL